MSTVFSQIISGKLSAEKIMETERILAIKDIHPIAPIHFLIIPKKEIRDLQSVSPEDWPLIEEMIRVAQQLANQYGIEKGYRLVTNIGKQGGQEIPHLHFHLIGGRQLGSLG